MCVCGHLVYDEEPRCPLCACLEHKPRLPAQAVTALLPPSRPTRHERPAARCYAPGETVIPAGRPPDCVQVIDEGLVRVTAHAGDGDDAFLRA